MSVFKRKKPTPQEASEVSKIAGTSQAYVGKPRPIPKKAMKLAYGGGGGIGFNYGGFGGGSLGQAYGPTIMGSGGNFYSPELSTDFLEIPQSIDEQRNYYRFFYDNDPFVGRAIDTHVEIPLSKVRLGMPQAKSPENRDLAEMSLKFCSEWSKKINLLQKLLYIAHDYNKLGEAFIYVSDGNPDVPKEVTHEFIVNTTPEEEGEEEGEEEKTRTTDAKELFERNRVEERESNTEPEGSWVERKDSKERLIRWMKKNYKGWTQMRVLPPEQIQIENFPLCDEIMMDLVFDSKTKNVVEQARSGDRRSIKIRNSMPREFVEAIEAGESSMELNTDPEEGSFCFYMPNKKSEYEARGKSILQRCLRILIYRDKLRQAQTSISSRHMTPMRLVTVLDGDEMDIDLMREQVDLALQDPDYSIITNFQVEWQEMGADQRLLDLASEYDLTDRQMYAGLGVTESLLSGESSYSGDRINLEVINTRYMLFRELMQDFAERNLFEPMCRKMGFVEEIEDEYGDVEEHVLVPSLSFTRLPIRDTQDTFDVLFNLYQKGSLDIDVILEMYNIDPIKTREKLKKDLFTVNDATFNDLVRTAGNDAVTKMMEGKTNLPEKVAESLGLDYEPPSEEGDGRF